MSKEIQDEYDWIFFCDDDDYYEPNRIDTFQLLLKKYSHIDGIYESQEGIPHQQYRYEYWSYCIRPTILKRFFEIVEEQDQIDTLENSCCDIMLVEYLRRLDPAKYPFCRLDAPKLYHYRRVNNEESVTEIISKNEKAMRKPNPPSFGSEKFVDYIVEWNDYLHENIHFYKHDVYVRTIVGCDLDYILKTEFKEDYPYIEFVDACHLETLVQYHHRLVNLCCKLYDATQFL
jgi:glycosyltransferase involved in cell wall biosynthesis